MWTTSNSRVERSLLGLSLACCLLTACTSSLAPGRALAPDAPQPARKTEEKPRSLPLADLSTPVELKSVTATRMPEKSRALFGPAALENARDPLVIEVQTELPLDLTPRTSFPVIVLNGEALESSRVSPEAPDRLLALLRDREAVRPVNTVAVVWIGNEDATRTRRPLVFTAEDATAGRTRTHSAEEGTVGPPR